MNLWIIFITGLTTGGLSCLAVQGGFLASIIANQKEKELEHPTKETNLKSFDRRDWVPVASFLTAKLFIHTVLGFFLGVLGSVLTLSLEVRLLFQVLAALFMLATAMNLLHVHPIFRYVVFQPPKFITKQIRFLSKSDFMLAPFLLGLCTIFIPCGITQAMEVQAIALGNPVQSALVMCAFVLGTMPLFAILGVAMAKLSEGLTKRFLHVAAIALIGMALFSINGVFEVINFPVSASKISHGWIMFWTPKNRVATQNNTAQVVSGSQQVTIDVLPNGYNPRYLKVKKGIPVSLTLRTNKVYSCAVDFHLKAFGIREFLQSTGEKTIVFTPKETGRYSYTCGMGMYTGVLEVI